MWKLSAPGGDAEHCFLRLHQTEFYAEAKLTSSPLEKMPNFKEVPSAELIPQAGSGYSFDTVTVDVPRYLNYLLSRFLEKGGRIIRGHVQHIEQVLESGSAPFQADKSKNGISPDAVVVCVGLGARFLGGVEDEDVYPSRGQTVILRAPWVRFGRSFTGPDEWSYIIPRQSGDVVVGGTTGANDWYPKSRPKTSHDILRRGLAICPELAPAAIRTARAPTVEDLLPIVVEEVCGLRPMRKGGFRIEIERYKMSNGREVPVVHNYG
ncbi:hypothetical protein B0H34DRAFT_476364 [Crassisporium funariophilum]|nr:hypothetical protein B0H34DRAFT_476364 [Crassisporium funariophilum]